MSNSYQEVHFSREAFDRVMSLPSPRIADKWREVKERGFAEIIHDSIRYKIAIGERRLFPMEVARQAIGQGAVYEDHRAGAPIMCFEVGEKSDGSVAVRELTCTAHNCKAGPFANVGQLMEHLASHNTGYVVGSPKINLEPVEDLNAAADGTDE